MYALCTLLMNIKCTSCIIKKRKLQTYNGNVNSQDQNKKYILTKDYSFIRELFVLILNLVRIQSLPLVYTNINIHHDSISMRKCTFYFLLTFTYLDSFHQRPTKDHVIHARIKEMRKKEKVKVIILQIFFSGFMFFYIFFFYQNTILLSHAIPIPSYITCYYSLLVAPKLPSDFLFRISAD